MTVFSKQAVLELMRERMAYYRKEEEELYHLGFREEARRFSAKATSLFVLYNEICDMKSQEPDTSS